MTTQVQVKIDPLAMAVILDVLGNIVVMLETNHDPMDVAQQIRDYIARHDAQEANR